MTQTGWKCPVCGKGNAPLAQKCGHCAENGRLGIKLIPEAVPFDPSPPWRRPTNWIVGR